MLQAGVLKKQSPWLFLLILAIVFGGFVRVWKISTLPFPPNGDELAFGYYGWSLLHYGSDEYGNRFPLYFPSIGDYKYPVLAYLNMIPAAIFGLNEITARFWSVVSGIVLIPLVFIFAHIIFGDQRIALAGAWFTAVVPWGISLSRYGYETNIALVLTLGGFLLLYQSGKTLTPKDRRVVGAALFTGSFLCFVAAIYCYGAERVFTPLFLLGLAILSRWRGAGLYAVRNMLLILFLFVTLLTALSLIPWQSRGRASGVLATSLSSEEQNSLNETAIEAGISPIRVPVVLTRIFHNKLQVIVTDFLQRYVKHFETDFLYFSAGTAVERIPGVGTLLLVQLLFFPAGLFFLLVTLPKNRKVLPVLLWLVLSPIPSALTISDPQMTRALLMLPSLSVISGYGFVALLDRLSSFWVKRSAAVMLILIITFNVAFVLNQLFVQKPIHYPWKTEQVSKEMTNQVFALKGGYQAVAIPNDDYISFLFYQKIPPTQFLSRATIRPATQNDQWERVERLDNIYFKMAYDCPREGKLNVLYVCKGPNIPQNAKVLRTIRYSDGVPAFTLLELTGPLVKHMVLPPLPDRLHYMVDDSTRFPGGIIPVDSADLW